MGDGRHDYWGYTTAGNTQLNESRRQAARMGEDIRYYPDPPSSGSYPNSTVDWNNPRMDEDSDEYRAAYGSDSVEKIYKRIMAQDPAAMDKVAHQWFNVYYTLENLANRVYELSDRLKNGGGGSDKGWTGAGADAFMARGPGATMQSIDAWRDAALINGQAAYALSFEMRTYRDKMETWYRDVYKPHMVSMSGEALEILGADNLEEIEDRPGDDGLRYVNLMRHASDHKVEEARAIQSEMAEAYRRVSYEEFAGGTETVYEGPSNAVAPNQNFINNYLKNKFAPNIPAPNIQQPNISKPNITAPNISADVLNQIEKPNGDKPNITQPNIDTSDLPTQEQVNDLKQPPQITPPNIGIPVLPPPIPPGLGKGLPTGAPPTIRTGDLPGRAPAISRALGDVPRASNPGVLRGVNAPTGEGLPSMPQGSRPGQNPPAQIKRPGQPASPPGMPQGNRGGPDRSPDLPGTPARPAVDNQFGGPPSAPSSPVLRNPRTGAGPDSRDPRRGTPGLAGPGANPSLPPGPPRPGTASPVLGRPRGSTPGGPTMPTTRKSTTPDIPGAPANPLAPPPPPTSNPVVGRTQRPAARTEPTSGVLRALRGGPSGYEAQIGSRRREQEPEVSTVETEFDKIAKLLDKEAAWTVATPGGGVLDNAPPRATAPTSEPKPAIGS
ncbi:hypothetical protein WEI85_09910 [Actinomycetes bacterium KLBMP 9797]